MKKIYVGKSTISGKGLFAGESIKKGEMVFIMKGKILKINSRNKKRIIALPNPVGIDKDMWIDPAEPYVNLNHSCNPNMGVKGKVTFIALRKIKKGEEVTFDYSISEDSSWEMKCNCGSKNCRKIIRSIRYLPKECYNKYMPYIPSYFQMFYRKNVLSASK
jgi:uncharacterized protein